MESELLKFIRPVNMDNDYNLPVYSHSKIECYTNCPRTFKKKYVEHKVSEESSIALESGTLAHYLLERKGLELEKCGSVSDKFYDYLRIIRDEGYEAENIVGLNEIKDKYWEEYDEPDSNGVTYDQKWKTFERVLHREMEDDDWQPFAFERDFEFVWDNKVIIRGFIDRIDRKRVDGTTYYRVVDYKTSKKVFPDTKLKTAQQMAIYSCACLLDFGSLPIENLYSFIFIDEKQYALTKGWENRFIKKMCEIFAKIDSDYETDEFAPKPTPLCAWCNYSKTNPNAHDYKFECEYHSLWTPNEKTFAVNKKWEPGCEKKVNINITSSNKDTSSDDDFDW